MAVDVESPAGRDSYPRSDLDAPPPTPPGQGRPGSVMFRPPDEFEAGAGANGMGGDPVVQLMMAAGGLDKNFQQIVAAFPDVATVVAPLQQQARELVVALLQRMQGQAAGLGGAPMGGGAPPALFPPGPSGPVGSTQGQQMSPGI